MRRSWLLVALVAVALPVVAALAEGKEGKPVGKAEAEVRALLDEMNAAFSRKDAAWFVAHTAHDADMVNFGTDAAEIWVGWDAYKKAMDAQLGALGTAKGTLREVRVKVHRTGDVAWVSYLCDFTGTSGGQPFDVKDMRVSSVLEKRKGTWIFVSSHSSMGVQGQVVKY
jgi:uncharacterized protein (TIGR02246 family)